MLWETLPSTIEKSGKKIPSIRVERMIMLCAVRSNAAIYKSERVEW